MAGIKTPKDFASEFDLELAPEDEVLIQVFARAVAILAAGFGTSRVNSDQSFINRAQRFETYILTGE
jgi:hypothetical protein